MTLALRRLSFATSLAATLTAHLAFAQTDKAGAEALLKDGLALTAGQRYLEACPKFEESLHLYPSLNTAYFLADCYEHSGRMASAWIDYLEVADKAQAAGEKSKEQKARERAGSVEAKVSHLTIVVGEGAPEGLRIQRDGQDVGRAQWGVPMPVDAGKSVVIASAPGYVTLTLQATVGGDGDRAIVDVPALVAEAPALATAPPAEQPSSSTPDVTKWLQQGSSSTASTAHGSSPAAPDVDKRPSGAGQRAAGLVVLGVGGVGVVVGSILGVAAKVSYDGAQGCHGTTCDDQSGLDTRNSARRTGNVATIVFVGSAAAVAVGSVLWLTASNARAPDARTAPTWRLGVTANGALLGGRF